MNAQIIIYTIAHKTPAIRSKFNRELNGYKDQSYNSKYTYSRKGLINEITHIKPSKNILITPKKHTKKIIEFLQKYDAKIKTINIQINNSEFNK